MTELGPRVEVVTAAALCFVMGRSIDESPSRHAIDLGN
jgi:hypothetical protein